MYLLYWIHTQHPHTPIMVKKKRTEDSSLNSSPSSIGEPSIQAQSFSNLKAKTSDENLILPPSETESEQTLKAHEKVKKRSLVSLSGDENEEDDDFMFMRLKKQIKNHWDKLLVHYPNTSSLFKSPQPQHDQPVTTTVAVARNNSISTTNSSSTTKSAAIHQEPCLLSSAIKSALLLPGFSCKRDDEGHRTVPFISSLLEVHYTL